LNNTGYWDVLFLIVIGVTIVGLLVQWHFIEECYLGYSRNPKVKHPELNHVNAGDSLMSVQLRDEDMNELQKKVLQLKMRELFEEPSRYEDEDEEEW